MQTQCLFLQETYSAPMKSLRFEHEARALASLNHPNICVLHDIGSRNGTEFIVMEYLEGETLAARMNTGSLPLQQALTLAAQIADALDHAHRAGVAHRDVKPSNIMLTRDGVKVLDFGLAKSLPKGPYTDPVTVSMTAEGTVLGTPQYMAPEQLEGKEADARADIWSFGLMLYEMVTGQKAFRGSTYLRLATAVLSEDPAPMYPDPSRPGMAGISGAPMSGKGSGGALAIHARQLRSPLRRARMVPLKFPQTESAWLSRSPKFRFATFGFIASAAI